MTLVNITLLQANEPEVGNRPYELYTRGGLKNVGTSWHSAQNLLSTGLGLYG